MAIFWLQPFEYSVGDKIRPRDGRMIVDAGNRVAKNCVLHFRPWAASRVTLFFPSFAILSLGPTESTPREGEAGSSSFLHEISSREENRSEVKCGIKFEESSYGWVGASRSIEHRGSSRPLQQTDKRFAERSTLLFEERQYACKEHLDPLYDSKDPSDTDDSNPSDGNDIPVYTVCIRKTFLRSARGNFVIISPPLRASRREGRERAVRVRLSRKTTWKLC